MASDLTALAPQTSDSLPIGRNISRGTSVSEFSLATAETPPPPYSSVDNIYQLPNEDDGLPSGIHEDASPTPSASSSSRPSQELEPLTTVTREKGARRGPCQKPLPALPGRVETSRKGTGWNERLADDETRIEGTENERRRDGQFARTDSQGELTRLISFLVVTTSENWALVWDVCERVLASENNAKEAARALRRELKYGVPAAQLSAATLWTILLRNSSEAFFRYSTEIKFLDTVEDLIRSPRTSPVVKRRILSVIAIYRKDLRFQELWKRVKPLEYTDEDVPINSGDTQRHDSEDFDFASDVATLASTIQGLERSASPLPSPQGDIALTGYGSRAMTLYPYTASLNYPERVSFDENEILDILDQRGDWWQVRKADGTVGLAPSNFLQVVVQVRSRELATVQGAPEMR